MTFSLMSFPSAICLWCAVVHPSLGPEGSRAAKNNSRNRSHPKIHPSCSASHCGFSQQQTPLPGPVTLNWCCFFVLLWVFAAFSGVLRCHGGVRRADWGLACKSYYWVLFCQTGKTFLARNWKDFSGALGFGSPRQNVRYGRQLHHRATVRGRGWRFQNNM